jgi:hypothetical protein
MDGISTPTIQNRFKLDLNQAMDHHLPEHCPKGPAKILIF